MTLIPVFSEWISMLSWLNLVTELKIEKDVEVELDPITESPKLKLKLISNRNMMDYSSTDLIDKYTCLVQKLQKN
jgi:hypothetical protein